jgi:hypothetical protein
MPHGEGYIIGSDGLKHSSKWIMGIDSEVLWYYMSLYMYITEFYIDYEDIEMADSLY